MVRGEVGLPIIRLDCPKFSLLMRKDENVIENLN